MVLLQNLKVIKEDIVKLFALWYNHKILSLKYLKISLFFIFSEKSVLKQKYFIRFRRYEKKYETIYQI